jgi:MFS family permease
MTGGKAEIWVCAKCRSVNKLRSKQCYNCRTPKERGAVDPLTMDPTLHGQVREISLPDFRSSRPLAIVATFLILIVAVMQVVSTLATSSMVTRLLDRVRVAEGEIAGTGYVALATLGVALLALIAWSAWLSMVVRTMTALGLGYPAANGRMAFIENFLPGLNLYRIPAIVRDVVRRLEPTEGRGGALIFAAWIGLLAGFLIARFGPIISAFSSRTIEGAMRNQLVVQGLATGVVVVGAIFLVMLIWWIEVRIARHRRQQLADLAGAPIVVGALPALAGVGSAVAWPSTSARVMVPGPLGAMPAPIVTGRLPAASIATATAAVAIPTPPLPVVVADDQPHAERTSAALEPAAGPRIHLRVERDASMVATLDGESEPITLDGLRAAATALAHAGGSATVTADATSPEARSRAQEALEILTNARVPADLEG